MARLVLLNGAPGSGKSTVAAALADGRPLTLALDVDALKHSLGRWDDDAVASGLQARRLSLAVARQHLDDGFDVVVAQFVVRPAFAEQLAATAREAGARFHEVVLWLDDTSLSRRLTQRAERPTRPEHAVNNALVGPADARWLLDAVEAWVRDRPDASRVDASGSRDETVRLVRGVLEAHAS